MLFKKLAEAAEKLPIKVTSYIPEGVDADRAEIKGIVCDSRKAAPGLMFAATKGGHTDAHTLIPSAAEKGACAVLCEHRVDYPVCQLITEDVRAAMGYIGSEIFGDPSGKMTMIALTGTNGKTTSTFMTKSILEHAGIKTGLMGTIIYDDGKTVEEAEHTTPEGADLQTLLDRMVQNGCSACVMETSSHSISQGRINGITFDRAGFTNLTLEHLDFHKTMENYFLAKKTLFDKYMRGNWKACVNIDDAYGVRLREEIGSHAVTYSMTDEGADFWASIKHISVAGLDIEIKTPDLQRAVSVRLPVLGAYNVSNALQALSIAWSLGISSKSAMEALEKMPQVPGRLERYHIAGGGSCVIDFAHSSDGLEKVLTAVRPICEKKLVVVFGAGGDRDRTKRPVMGEIASRLGDYVIVTSDNPRSEDPVSIMKEIEPGVKEHDTPYIMIPDRREAIYAGLDHIEAGDIVVIAGRGPETHQILKDGPIPLVDKEIMLDWLTLRGREITK